MKIFLALAMLLTVAAIPASSASAPTIGARVILDATATGTGQPIVLPQGRVRAIVTIVEIPAGYAPGYHKHPYPRYAYVLSGQLDVQDERGGTRHYATGDFFIETLGGWHRPHVVGDTPVRLLVIDQTPIAAKTNTIAK